MWVKGNKIKIDKINNNGFLLIRFNCGLCNGKNEILFYSLIPDFFIRRPHYIWSTNIGCTCCEKSNYHDIKIFYEDGFLIFDFENERNHQYFYNNVDKTSISYSLDKEDQNKYMMEIPLDFDAIESIIGNDSFLTFTSSIKEIQELLSKPEIRDENLVLKIIFSNVVTIFETYLSDLIINIINSDRNSLRKIVEDYGIFQKERIEKTNIFNVYETIKDSVISELQKISYHNLRVVIPLYKKTLSIDFADKITGLPEAIEIRHDIVHRNGKDFFGNMHEITLEKI